MDSPLHYLLKKFGKLLLMNSGYYKIEEEYAVTVGNAVLKVDLVGFSGDRKMAVECAVNRYPSPVRLRVLRKVFNDVYVVTVEHVLNKFFELYDAHKELEEQLKWSEELRTLQSQQLADAERKVDELKMEKRRLRDRLRYWKRKVKSYEARSANKM